MDRQCISPRVEDVGSRPDSADSLVYDARHPNLDRRFTLSVDFPRNGVLGRGGLLAGREMENAFPERSEAVRSRTDLIGHGRSAFDVSGDRHPTRGI